jgi:hypothetical protein
MIRLKCGSPFLRLIVLLGVCGAASPVFAQNWMGDARQIGMGGAGTSQNLSSGMVKEEGKPRTIVIPLGLFQVLRDLDIYNPSSDQFDLVRSIEYAASPLHYTFNRDGTGTGVEFINDIVNGRVSRDLNVYRGFVPVTQPIAYGLANPSFGGTIPVFRSDAVTHGIYVGAGPYLSMRGALTVDEQLVEILSSDTNVYIPNAQLPIDSAIAGQVAVAITGGYRGKFALPSRAGTTGDRDGLYVAFNYNYLRGFWYDDADIAVRFETDSAGLLTLTPTSPIPVAIVRDNSTSGRGFALDFGATVISDRWELGFGASGVANRINWTGVEQTTYAIPNILLFLGGDFVESPTIPRPDARVELPTDYTGSVGYNADHWSVVGEVGQLVSNNPADDDNFSGTRFRTGAEYRFTIFEPRGGVFYTRERWQPTAGLGFNFGAIGVDTAVYTTDANVERKRKVTFAVSLRIGSRRR